MTPIKTQLTQDLAAVQWEDLMPHAQRDAVIVVTALLDLVEVGVAIAQDDTQQVQRWISEQLIYKPSAAQLSAWNLHPDQVFGALIVQPFVLIRADKSPTPV
jgi:hypothetical protein